MTINISKKNNENINMAIRVFINSQCLVIVYTPSEIFIKLPVTFTITKTLLLKSSHSHTHLTNLNT